MNDIVEPILGINVRITWDVWNAEMRIPLDFKWIATIRNKPAICGVQHNYTVTLDTWVFQRVPFPMHPRANITGIHHGYIWSIYWSSIMGIFCIHTSIHPYIFIRGIFIIHPYIHICYIIHQQLRIQAANIGNQQLEIRLAIGRPSAEYTMI